MRTGIQAVLLSGLVAVVLGQELAAIPCIDLVLPWGTYPGSVGKGAGETAICHYPDVRFGSAPMGKLRFAAPEYPPATTDGKAAPAPGKNMSCIQMSATSCLLGGPVGASGPSCFPARYGTQDEDCLFLDIYVPQKFMQSGVKLPVVVWIYGGGYTSGSKSQFDPTVLPFYDGDGPVNTATSQNIDTSVVFVAGNYRLGAYGWLSGTYMENNGQPNAGLLDQRAVLQFVRDHISKVNGDPQSVSVWGESAGASSIMHHLAMPNNIKDPLFNRAVLQSPAYQWMWNRTGVLNDTFTTFAQYVATNSTPKCPVANMDCLRNASSDVIKAVNQNFSQVIACKGILPFGPAVDGKLVPALAPYQFKLGKVTPLKSIVVSHVDLEIPYANCTSDFSFLPKPIRCNPQNDAIMQNFLDEVFTGTAYNGIKQEILNVRYPRNQFSDEIARAISIITDVSFTCHTRFIINQYLSQKTPVYAMDYAIGMVFDGTVYNMSFHASDLLPLFSKQATNYRGLLKCLKPDLGLIKAGVIDGVMRDYISPAMQAYFVNTAMGADINTGNRTGYSWNQAKISGCAGSTDTNKCVWNLMVPSTAHVLKGFWFNNTGPDLSTSDRVCAFWDQTAGKIAQINGALETGRMDVNEEQFVFNEEL